MYISKNHMTVPGNIRAIMCEKGITAEDLSAKLMQKGVKIQRPQLSRRLEGETNFTVDEVFAIAEIFKINAGILMESRTTLSEFQKLKKRVEALEKGETIWL